MDTAKAYFKRLRSEDEFERFYDATVKLAEQLSINQPVLPRRRRCPARFQEGASPHEYPSPRDFYRHMFFEACDLLITELESHHIPSVLSLEKAIVKAANGDDFESEVAHLRESCYKHDIEWSDLMRHLPMLQDITRDTYSHIMPRAR